MSQQNWYDLGEKICNFLNKQSLNQQYSNYYGRSERTFFNKP